MTGGTGSIGSQLVREALKHSPKRVIVFSRDDSKHFYLQQELRDEKAVRFIIGDVRDTNALSRAFALGVDVVLHAAALKHVAICEQNPAEAVKTNILGTQNLVDLCLSHGVQKMITISTDKAVNPSCTMGATKYIAEKLTLAAHASRPEGGTVFSCVRFGNVLGSRGSVIPAFLRSLRTRGALWVSDPLVTRFAITIEEAAELVLQALTLARGGETFVLKMDAFELGQLVEVFQGLESSKKRVPIHLYGLSPGEKRHEELVTLEESARLFESDRFFVIQAANAAPGRNGGPKLRRSKLQEVRSDRAPRIPPARLRAFVKTFIQRAVE